LEGAAPAAPLASIRRRRRAVLLAEDEVSLLEGTGGAWAELGAAIRDFRGRLPLCRLEDFGFAVEVEHPLEEPNPRLRNPLPGPTP
jgi:hypothetical protein